MKIEAALARANPADDIHFDPETHTYHYRGKLLRSVTKFLRDFFHPFDAEAMAERMSRATHRPEYFGREPASILAEWDQKNAHSLQRGILLHDEIDQFLTGNLTIKQATSPLFPSFLGYWQQISPTHIASEQILFDEELGLAGTIDEIARAPDGILLCDWKTAKGDVHKHFNKKCLAPIDHLPASAFIRYSLQLNIYATLFYRTFGVKVHQLQIVLLQQNGWHMLPAPFLREEVSQILAQPHLDY